MSKVDSPTQIGNKFLNKVYPSRYSSQANCPDLAALPVLSLE